MMTCYDDAVRTIIELPSAQLDALDALCRRDGISRAEAIRRAVAAMVAGATTAGRAAAYGLWRDRGINGLTYERRLRAEWDGGSAKPNKARARRRS